MGLDIDWKFVSSPANNATQTSRSVDDGIEGAHVGYQTRFGTVVGGAPV